MARVAPSARFRTQLDEVLAGVGQEQDPVETIGRLGARLILQQALEDEVTEFLGRRCQRPSVSPQLWPSFLPNRGHDFSPLVAIFSPHHVGAAGFQVSGFTPLPEVAWASR